MAPIAYESRYFVSLFKGSSESAVIPLNGSQGANLHCFNFFSNF